MKPAGFLFGSCCPCPNTAAFREFLDTMGGHGIQWIFVGILGHRMVGVLLIGLDITADSPVSCGRGTAARHNICALPEVLSQRASIIAKVVSCPAREPGGAGPNRRRGQCARTACKPDSVTARRRRRPFLWARRCRRARAANPDRSGGRTLGPRAPRDPYLALLLAGLAVPPALPPARWALTPPFHPCPRPKPRGRSDLCGAFPRVTPGGRYPPPSLPGVRTFLDPGGPRPSGRPRAA